MDRKQAIEIFKSRLEISDYEKQIPEYYQAMRMAVEALKKQIPEIPAYEDDFCTNCGQAIDRRECSEEE